MEPLQPQRPRRDRVVATVRYRRYEVLAFAPYFSEYVPYINESGAVLKIVPANSEDFQINFEAFAAMLNPNVHAVLINTPNNPSGVIYSADTLRKLAALVEKQL